MNKKCSEKLNERDFLEDTGLVVKIILQYMLRKRMRTSLRWFRIVYSQCNDDRSHTDGSMDTPEGSYNPNISHTLAILNMKLCSSGFGQRAGS